MKKRSLAAPFVLTALMSPVLADDTLPQNPPQKRKLPKAPNENLVIRHPDGTCWYPQSGHCPPNTPCNPPPPRQVECPPPKK